MKPEEIKCIDPCCGSGHILAYLFDVLVQIYESYGYTTREAVESIVKNNLYGLDIDDRAAQLAYFAVMMKARQYDRRFFSRQIQPNVYAIQESNGVDRYALEYFCNGDSKLKAAMDSIIKEMHDAKEYGSILNITPVDFAALHARFDEVRDDISMSKESVLNSLLPLVQVAGALAQKYDVVCTNPPYMGLKSMSQTLFNYVMNKHPLTKNDLYGVFMQNALEHFAESTGFVAMITQHIWMFTSGFEKYRDVLFSNHTIMSMIHLGTRAFEEISGEVVQTCAFVIGKQHLPSYNSSYARLVYSPSATQKEQDYLMGNYRYNQKSEKFNKIPGHPVCYWLSQKVFIAYEENPLVGDVSTTRQGLKTSDDKRFVRFLFEVDPDKDCE